MLLKKSEIQILEKGYSDKDRDNIRDWLIDILPRIINEYKDNCRSFPKSMNPDGNINFNSSLYDKWKDTLNKIVNYLNEASDSKCHWQNKYRLGSKKYIIEQEKIDAYRVKCLHKALRILDFYIEDIHI